MKLCYQCYVKVGEEVKRSVRLPKTFSKAWDMVWDLTEVDTTKRRRCEVCGKEGVFVREFDLGGD